MKSDAMKVGELARQTGLTVRTLHHYDEIGLLKPSQHTEAGYRLYSADDIARLQRVTSLRQIGFSLQEIRDCLDQPGFSPLEVVRLHAAHLQEQIQRQRTLAERLDVLAEHLAAQAEVPAAEFLQAVETMTAIERYCPADRCGNLFAAVFAELSAGTEPSAPRAQELAREWAGVMAGAAGLGADFQRTLREMCDGGEGVAGADVAPMRRALEFLRRAADAAGIEQTV